MKTGIYGRKYHGLVKEKQRGIEKRADRNLHGGNYRICLV